MCDPLPFLEDMVDFHALNQMNLHFYMNAFSVTERYQTLYANQGTTTQREDYTKEDFRFRDLPTTDSKKGGSEKRESTKSGLKMHLFYNKKEGIHPEEVRAAFAYPFIYPPVAINGEVYFEGAGRDPISSRRDMPCVVRARCSSVARSSSRAPVGTTSAGFSRSWPTRGSRRGEAPGSSSSPPTGMSTATTTTRLCQP